MCNYPELSSVTVLIPAYNEEATISSVVQACQECPYVAEIIVVDDGSSDCTGDRAYAAGARVLFLPENLGKAAALFFGAKTVNTPWLLLLDADLIGLENKHVASLITPVLNKTADSTLGLFTKGRFRTDLAHTLTPFLSGQRCLYTSFFLTLEEKANVRYGIEIAITKALKKQNLRIKKVSLDGVTHRMKEEKSGHESGWLKRMEMYRDIIVELFR